MKKILIYSSLVFTIFILVWYFFTLNYLVGEFEYKFKNNTSIQIELRENLMTFRDPEVQKTIRILKGNGESIKFVETSEDQDLDIFLLENQGKRIWVINDRFFGDYRCDSEEKKFYELYNKPLSGDEDTIAHLILKNNALSLD